VLAIVVGLLRVFGMTTHSSPRTIALIGLAPILLGLAAGGIGLRGTKEYGSEGIMIHAVVGLILNVLFLITSLLVLMST
jgi:hypothetical protein